MLNRPASQPLCRGGSAGTRPPAHDETATGDIGLNPGVLPPAVVPIWADRPPCGHRRTDAVRHLAVPVLAMRSSARVGFTGYPTPGRERSVSAAARCKSWSRVPLPAEALRRPVRWLANQPRVPAGSQHGDGPGH